MIPVYAIDLPRPPVLTLYQQHESGIGQRSGWVTVGSDQPVSTVVSRTVAVPDRSPSRDYATATSASGGEAVHGLVVHVVPLMTDDDRVPRMLAEAKRVTGWTWDRLAAALGRTRQAVHGWTLGREITQANVERIARLHSILVYIDRGTAEENRALLNKPIAHGQIAADLIDEGKFDQLREILGRGGGSRNVALWTSMADEERRAADENWFDRLATTRGAESVLEIVNAPGNKRRVAVRPSD